MRWHSGRKAYPGLVFVCIASYVLYHYFPQVLGERIVAMGYGPFLIIVGLGYMAVSVLFCGRVR